MEGWDDGATTIHPEVREMVRETVAERARAARPPVPAATAPHRAPPARATEFPF